jgi:hypothetical protein
MCFQCSFPEYKAKQETNIAVPSNQPLENCVSYLTCTRYSYKEGHGCRAHSTNSEDGNTIVLSGRKLLSVLAVSFGTFEHDYLQSGE